MEIYINHPTNEQGKKALSKAVAKFHATLILKAVEDLNLDNMSKKKIIKNLLDIMKEQSKNSAKELGSSESLGMN